MQRRPLWPLVPPLAVGGMLFFFITITNLIKSPLTECGFRKLTGFHCPGCGGTRCAHNIANGHWAAAMGYNPMLMSGFLIFLALSLYLIFRMTLLGKPAPKMPNIQPKWIWFGVAAMVLFTILRNIPVFPFSLMAP